MKEYQEFGRERIKHHHSTSETKQCRNNVRGRGLVVAHYFINIASEMLNTSIFFEDGHNSTLFLKNVHKM